MLDIAPSEFLLVAFVALVVIGPKDLPKAMRVLGYWVGRARAVGRQFRAGFDEMVREAELEEMEKKWKAENERIMREHPFVPAPPALPDQTTDAPGDPTGASAHDDGAVQQPVMVEKPHVAPADPTAPGDRPAGDTPLHNPLQDRAAS
ncbi:sec-independent protein translocase protein TatB [Sphingomonas sp. BE138]|uniref:Sec-independent protein translocase protein TatB n=1 Tax=Sphingomonas sp. BE138 TaxID=2817845 RepID=UPI002857BC2B|nr:Sec-independent protein translocase protein TatB [Sphingomonas sp. BE138]MDR6789397.1 sec-independent protein translocase protein TatB [Sphingomonas sp. BE138]